CPPALQHAPTPISRFHIVLPPATTTKTSMAVIASLHSARQLLHLFHVATTEDNGIGDKRELQLGHAVKHFPAPGFFDEVLQPLYADPVFNFAMITIGQITEIDREKVILPNQRRAQPCARPEE